MKKNLLNFSRARDPEGQTLFAYGARRELKASLIFYFFKTPFKLAVFFCF